MSMLVPLVTFSICAQKYVKTQEIEKEQAATHEKCFPNTVSFDNCDIKDKRLTPNEENKMEKEVKDNKKLQMCQTCKYTCT